MIGVDISPALAKLHALGHAFVAMLPNVVLAVIIFIISCILARWARKLIVSFYGKRAVHQNVGLVLGRLLQATIILLNFMFALSIVLPSFSARDVIQVLGIGGVAVGFAFRDVLQNFLAGILILLAQPFRIGEEIAVGDVQGFVQEVQTRATLIRTGDGFLVVIPNSRIYTETVTVFNAYDTRRSSVEFSIGLRENHTETRRLIRDAITGIDGVLSKPEPSAIYVGAAPGSVTIRARWWTNAKQTDDVVVRDQVIPAITKRLLENGIDITYPTQHILFHDQTEETDGDRHEQRAGWPAGINNASSRGFERA
jgi:small-conductance mechanosensitive channel